MNAELHLDGHDPSTLWVTRYDIDEQLSEVYEARVVVETKSAIDPEELLDRPAALVLDAFGTRRVFQGLVFDASEEVLGDGLYRLEVGISPRLAACGLGRGSRIFQDANVEDVVGAVLADAGVERVAWDLTEKHPKRPFVLQRQESDLDFVRRLLAEEGVGFAFRQGDEGEQLVLFDDSTRLEPIEGQSTIYDRAASQLLPESAWEVRERRATASDAVVTKDYDLRRPSVDLTGKRSADGAVGREVYLHPGGFLEESEGKRRAAARLEALRTRTRVFEGKSSCARLEPGRKVTLQGTPHAMASIDHLLLAVRHRGFRRPEGDGYVVVYENGFTSIPADVRWRPLMARSGVSRGPELAVVTAPPGEEIHCDEFGRVKVRFLWDKEGPADDRSSTWLRVGQLALGGALVLPRAGFEVMVDFEQGDLDRPVVVGHLYNGESKPPYDLPADKTRSSFQSATTSGGPGANELRFEDAAGAEEIFFNASKDFAITVHDDARELVANERKVSVGASRTVTVGQDHRANVTGDRKLTVAGSMEVKVAGDLSDGVGGSETIAVGGTRRVEVGGDAAVNVAGSFERTVGSLEAVTAIVGLQRKTAGSSQVTVGAAWAELVAGARMSSCGGSRTESAGAAKLVKAKGMKVSAGGNVLINAGALATKAGGSRTDSAKAAVAVTAAGAVSIKAANITIEGKGMVSLVAGGVSIVLTPGSVYVTAPSIKLTGVKQLADPLHKSN